MMISQVGWEKKYLIRNLNKSNIWGYVGLGCEFVRSEIVSLNQTVRVGKFDNLTAKQLY